MDRRDFVRNMALIAAGTAALPEQIAAFERYYTVNSPNTTLPLMAIDEIMWSGLAASSLRLELNLIWPASQMAFAINAYGGILRWVAAPDQKIITPTFDWRITSIDGTAAIADDGTSILIPHQDLAIWFVGHISYIDHNLMRHNEPLTVEGSI